MIIQWPLVLFTLFVCLGCGLLFHTVIITEWYGKAKQIRMKCLIISLLCLAIGGFCSTAHLGHPDRIFAALGHPTSGIFMESMMIGLTGLLICIYILALRRGAAASTCKTIGCIGGVLSVILSFVNGDAYVMAAIPAWNTMTLPLVYVASAGVMGALAIGTILALDNENSNDELHGYIKKNVTITIGIFTLLLVTYLIFVANAAFPAPSRSLSRILGGDIALVFWGGIIILGIIIPFILVRKSTKIDNSIKIALVSALLGGIAFRSMMFLIGSSVKQYFG